MSTFSDYVKNIFWVLVLLQFAPLFISGIKKHYSEMFEQKTKVGVITINSMITAADPTIRHIKEIFTDNTIKAVVLKINSPGGVAPSAQAIFYELLHFKKAHPEKYVIAFTETMAASGGYYIAAGADYIISTPSSLIGSIGVKMVHPNFKKFIEQFNIEYDITKTGSYKAAGDPFLTMSPAVKEQFQEMSNNVYKQFIRDVAKQRPQLSSDTTKWAEGRIFTGEQALELSLIDQLGSQSTVEQALRDKAPIVGRIEWIKPAKKTTFFASLFAPEEDNHNGNYLSLCINAICDTLENRYSTKLSL